MRGIVKWFDANKGYGFLIDSETKDEIFVHYSQLQIQGYKLLNTDDIVNFELGAGNNGRKQAICVSPFLTSITFAN